MKKIKIGSKSICSENHQEIKKEIELFLYRGDKNIIGYNYKYAKGQTFYRVRRCVVNELKTSQDFWNRITPGPMGRLNYGDEYPIYLCTIPEQAILETDTKLGEGFLLIEYEATRDISLVRLGNIEEKDLLINGLSTDYIRKEKIKFVDYWMKRSKGDNRLNYTVTNAIKDCYVQALDPSVDGFYYLSVFDKEFGNIMIFENRLRQALKIKSAKYCWVVHRKEIECGLLFVEYDIYVKSGKIQFKKPGKPDDELIVIKRSYSDADEKYFYPIIAWFTQTDFFKGKSSYKYESAELKFTPWN